MAAFETISYGRFWGDHRGAPATEALVETQSESGGFASTDTQWEDIAPTSGAYMAHEMSDDARKFGSAVQAAFYSHLGAALPGCFAEVVIPDSLNSPYFTVTFLLDIEVGNNTSQLIDVTIYDVVYSDETLERCFLSQFEGKETFPTPGGLESGARIRFMYPMSMQIAEFVERGL